MNNLLWFGSYVRRVYVKASLSLAVFCFLLLVASFKKFMNFKPFVERDHHGDQRLSAVVRVFAL